MTPSDLSWPPSPEDVIRWNEEQWARAVCRPDAALLGPMLLGRRDLPDQAAVQARWMTALIKQESWLPVQRWIRQCEMQCLLEVVVTAHAQGGVPALSRVMEPYRPYRGGVESLNQSMGLMVADLLSRPVTDRTLPLMRDFIQAWEALSGPTGPADSLRHGTWLAALFEAPANDAVVDLTTPRGSLLSHLWNSLDWEQLRPAEVKAWFDRCEQATSPDVSASLFSQVPAGIRFDCQLGRIPVQCTPSRWSAEVRDAVSAVRSRKVMPRVLGDALWALNLSLPSAWTEWRQVALVNLLEQAGDLIPVRKRCEAYQDAALWGHTEALRVLAPHVPFESPCFLPKAKLKSWSAPSVREALDRLLEHAPTAAQKHQVRRLFDLPSALDENTMLSRMQDLELFATAARYQAVLRAQDSRGVHVPAVRRVRPRS